MSRLKAVLRCRKFRVLAVCLLLAAAGGGWWWFTRNPLAEFVDQDLRKLDDGSQTKRQLLLAKFLPAEFVSPKARLQKTLDRILPEEYRSKDIFAYEPWHLRHFNGRAESRLILLQIQQLWIVPGESRAAVHFLSPTGKHLASSDFSTGNRQSVIDAAFRFEPHVNDCVIEIQVSWFRRNPPTRLIYGIFADRVALIRVEDHKGALERNYDYGPDPPERSLGEWEEFLASENPLHLLEALTWTGRMHWGTTQSLVREIRATAWYQKRVLELCESENQWIRQAAIAARPEEFK